MAAPGSAPTRSARSWGGARRGRRPVERPPDAHAGRPRGRGGVGESVEEEDLEREAGNSVLRNLVGGVHAAAEDGGDPDRRQRLRPARRRLLEGLPDRELGGAGGDAGDVADEAGPGGDLGE